jgi:hypothetical protein
MAKRKKNKSKIPKRRRPRPMSSNDGGWNVLSGAEMPSFFASLIDSLYPFSKHDEHELEFGPPGEPPLCPCCGIPMTLRKNTPASSEFPMVGSPSHLSGHPYPKREDFPTLEAYYEYHRQSMLAFGIPPEEIRMEYVDPEFIAAIETDFEGGMRGSAMWNRMVEERGVEATEAHMQQLFDEVRAAKGIQRRS